MRSRACRFLGLFLNESIFLAQSKCFTFAFTLMHSGESGGGGEVPPDKVPPYIKKRIGRVLKAVERPIPLESVLPEIHDIVKEFIDIDFVYIKRITLGVGKDDRELEIELELDLEGKITGYKVSKSSTIPS